MSNKVLLAVIVGGSLAIFCFLIALPPTLPPLPEDTTDTIYIPSPDHNAPPLVIIYLPRNHKVLVGWDVFGKGILQIGEVFYQPNSNKWIAISQWGDYPTKDPLIKIGFDDELEAATWLARHYRSLMGDSWPEQTTSIIERTP